MPEITVPTEVRDSVLRELYRQVGSLPWDELSSREKTSYYSRWVEDPAIGGELADYHTAEGMRVWLKDGPLKEYARALEGCGPYARYTTKRLSPPSEFVPQVLDDSWSIVDGSLGEKPMHCIVTNGEQKKYICWGNPRTFRDLLWAAVNSALHSSIHPLIVVHLRANINISPAQEKLHTQIAKHCSIDLSYVHRTLQDRSPD